MRTRADSPTKTCTAPGCAGALRARGLCSTHYNQQHQPNRHASHAVPCTVCGVEVQRPTKARRRPTCSVACRTQLQHGVGAGTGGTYDWATDAACRARQAGATVVELFDRSEVFVRDQWICQLCGLPTDVTASAFDPASPTVDHVVPLSKGGEHTLANTQCSHLGCNSSKSDQQSVTGVGRHPQASGLVRPPGRALTVQTPDFSRGGDST